MTSSSECVFLFYSFFFFFLEIKLEEKWSFPAAHGRIHFSLRWNNGLRFEEQIWNGNSACTSPGELQGIGWEGAQSRTALGQGQRLSAARVWLLSKLQKAEGYS